MTTWTYASSKLGAITPATKSIARELFDAATKAGHDVWFMWGMGGGDEHGSGRALDLMVRNEAGGDFIRDYIWRNRERLRLRHVIWEQHITSTVVSPGVRRKMADRGSVTQNHYDHVHVWFFDGAYRAPSTSSGGSTSSTSSRTLARGSTGTRVRKLQHGMNTVFPAYSKLAVDGRFGPATEAVVREFQRRARIEVDGRVGPITTAMLLRYGVNIG
jgi:peptidoglycan hydrolase-like protein with peptidoglycan-binding domain